MIKCKIHKRFDRVVYTFSSDNKALIETEYDSGDFEVLEEPFLRGLAHFLETDKELPWDTRMQIAKSRLSEVEFKSQNINVAPLRDLQDREAPRSEFV